MEYKNNENSGKISVIIPAYNNGLFLGQCIESVLNQTYNNYEIIIINDASEDDTLCVAKEYEKKYEYIKVIDFKENKGQGYCRNYAMNICTGEYILFLDSDDFIEPLTLETTINKIQEDKSDLVVFDWKYYKNATKVFSYVNKEIFFDRKELVDEECLELLSIAHYFTVNKLYSRKFLKENDIKYNENYIYEDIPFWVNICLKAKKVSLIHSPLYNVRISTTSTTKTNMGTDWHCKSFIKAIRKSMELAKDSNKEEYYYMYRYFIKKFWLYYYKRTPRKFRKIFIKEFMNEMSKAELVKKDIPNKVTKYSFRFNVFKKNRVICFKTIYFLFRVKRKLRKEIKKIKSKIKTFIKIFIKPNMNSNIKYWKELKDNVKKDIILFMGFDYRYTGNSRYLFEQIIKEREENVFFVTDSTDIDNKYKVKPNSDDFYKLFYNARIVIFESWIPASLRKTKGAIWIQLWHGTPLKKMLYDSDEKEIITANQRHKIIKYNDIQRWNYFLTDNNNINKYFQRAFLLPKEKILSLGYPRVDYLLSNIHNNDLKIRIKEKANLSLDKKIVVYLPTWRDYNYGVKEEGLQFDYIINEKKLKNLLGEEYLIVTKDHAFLGKNENATNTEIETQELLLIADYLITDYSSVMFDAFAADIPVILFANDYDKYMNSRGVYSEMWNNMQNMICVNEEDVATMIKEYDFGDYYNFIKKEYCYNNSRTKTMKDFVLKMVKNKGKNIQSVMIFGDFEEVNNNLMRQIAKTKEYGNKTVIGIKNGTENSILFNQKKSLLENIKGIQLIVPLKGEKPTNDEIEKLEIDTIICEEKDKGSYNCEVIIEDNV